MKKTFDGHSFAGVGEKVDNWLARNHSAVSTVVFRIEGGLCTADVYLEDEEAALKQHLSEKFGIVGVFFSERDIRAIADELSDEDGFEPLDESEVTKVRELLERTHNSEVGLSWDTIGIAVKDIVEQRDSDETDIIHKNCPF